MLRLEGAGHSAGKGAFRPVLQVSGAVGPWGRPGPPRFLRHEEEGAPPCPSLATPLLWG